MEALLVILFAIGIFAFGLSLGALWIKFVASTLASTWIVILVVAIILIVAAIAGLVVFGDL